MKDFAARWPMGFARRYVRTLIDYGDVTREEGAAIVALLDAAEQDSHALVITPGVLHIAAVKP